MVNLSRRVTQRMSFAVASGFLLLTTACAGPYGGAPLILARVELSAVPGYVVSKPDIVSKPQGALIHGRICRRSPTAYPITRLSVHHVKADGSVIAKSEAYVYGMSSWRRPGCAYYSAETTWRVVSDDTIRVASPRDEDG